MVESLQELNKICQKPHYKEKGNWMVRTFLRDAALPITWLLLHTSVSANQVTSAALGIGLLGLLCLASPSAGCFFTGMLLIQLWYLLDHVDGQIARYRKTVSLSGRFYDFIMHHIIHGIFFFALSWCLYSKTDNVFFLFWGFVTSFSIISFNLLQDTKYKTFFEWFGSAKNISQKISSAGNSGSKEEADMKRRAFSFLHKSIEMHVCMNVYTLTAFVMVLVKNFPDFRFPLFFYYGLAAPFCFIAKTIVWIKSKKIDSEFQASFELSGDPNTP